jgi:hypothetical protein
MDDSDEYGDEFDDTEFLDDAPTLLPALAPAIDVVLLLAMLRLSAAAAAVAMREEDSNHTRVHPVLRHPTPMCIHLCLRVRQA